jgi:hypothetical protein
MSPVLTVWDILAAWAVIGAAIIVCNLLDALAHHARRRGGKRWI